MSRFLKDTIARHAFFFVPFLLFLLAGAWLMLAYKQEDIFLYVNIRHQNFLDRPMIYYTEVGNGYFYAACILVMLFIRVRMGLTALIAWILETGLVQVCKIFIFPTHTRPWKTLAEKGIYIVEGAVPYTNNSFPSGHTASAFCLFTLLTLFVPSRLAGLLFFLLALLVAFSRIYLSQHYFIDVYYGAIFGVVSAIGVYAYFYRSYARGHVPDSRLDRSLLNLFK